MARGEGERNWRLPALRGWWRRGYEALWLALLAAALVVTGLTVWESEWDGTYRIPLLKVGVNYTRDNGPGLVVFDVSSPEARAAGIGSGDRIVAINGAEAGSAGLDSVIDATEGDAVILGLSEPGRPAREVTLTIGNVHVEGALRAAGFSGAFMAGWTLAMLILATALGIFASILLFLKQRHNPVAALLALIPLIGAATGYGAMPIAAVYAAITLTQILLPIALLAFPDGRFVGRLNRLLLAANLLWTLTSFYDPILHNNGALVLLAASGMAVAARIRRSPSADERQQLRWAMLGFAGTAFCALALLVCLQLQYLRNDLWYVIVNDMVADVFDVLYSVCLWGGLLVALLRYRLYDVDAAITRSAVWALAAPLLAFVFAATIEVLKVALGPVLGNDMVVVPSAGALTAMLIAPVGGWIERRVEIWSRRDLIALARDLPAAARDLGEQDDPVMLLDHACRCVRRAMKAQKVAIIVRNDANWETGAAAGTDAAEITIWLTDQAPANARVEIEIVREDAAFPLRVPLVAHPTGEPEAIAWLLVGRRPDGSIQDKDARATLADIAPALGRALHAIAARRRHDAALIDRIEARFAPPGSPGKPPQEARLRRAMTRQA